MGRRGCIGLAGVLALAGAGTFALAQPAPKPPPQVIAGQPLSDRLTQAIRAALTSPATVGSLDAAGRVANAIVKVSGGDVSQIRATLAVLGGLDVAQFADPAAAAKGIAAARQRLARELVAPQAAMQRLAPQILEKPATAPPPPVELVLPPPPPPPPPDVVAASPARPTTPPAAASVIPPAPASAPATAPPAAAPAGLATGGAPKTLDGMRVVYNTPANLPLAERTDFRLYILSGPGQPDFSGAPGPQQMATVPAAKVVKAELTGPTGQVDIDAGASPVCQTVTADNQPVWDWFVTPRTTGRINLELQVFKVASCADDAPIVSRLYDVPIPVTATWWEFVLNYARTWQGVLAAVLGLIAAAGGAFGAWKWLGKGGS